MNWWNRLWRSTDALAGTLEPSQWVHLTLPGWNEGSPVDGLRVWHDSDGDALSLAIPKNVDEISRASDEMELRQRCREFAQNCGAGLIEANALPYGTNSASLIYKRLNVHAYVYSGMFMTSVRGNSLLWTIVASERGVTGVREAVVASNLMNADKLTVDDYKRYWAEDPYESAYRGVDQRVLRFISDDESYDDQFPHHPLSKVRHVLAMLPSSVQFDSEEL